MKNCLTGWIRHTSSRRKNKEIGVAASVRNDRCCFYARRNSGIFYAHFQEVVTHGGPDQGYYGGFWRGDGGRDGEFYAEGVLKMYSFQG